MFFGFFLSFQSIFAFSLLFFLLCYCYVALCIMDSPPIPEDFGSIDGASFDFDDFLYGTGDAEVVQSGAQTFDAAGAT